MNFRTTTLSSLSNKRYRHKTSVNSFFSSGSTITLSYF
ncbi:hypothetical protein LptCag_0059 [Leptospirillum ferriphilum]|uniref:Uncharacterized protein n=1 Tax=Leptospirillum ferriphilum TaxID=178606 RepID=A0A094YJQ9_9BACT|nr:hypothetical protein LptCag_0059 [Leptospirillum ferriphilum]